MSLPTYDQARDGHVFRWILRAAEQVREQRRGVTGREYVRIVERRRADLPKSRPDER